MALSGSVRPNLTERVERQNKTWGSGCFFELIPLNTAPTRDMHAIGADFRKEVRFGRFDMFRTQI
jgi:hypothetical protein